MPPLGLQSAEPFGGLGGRLVAPVVMPGVRVDTTFTNGTQNDFAVPGGVAVLRFNGVAAGARTLTGLAVAGVQDRQFLLIENDGLIAITITSNDGGSAAANRFISPGGDNLSFTLDPSADILFVYSTLAGGWIPLGLSRSKSVLKWSFGAAAGTGLPTGINFLGDTLGALAGTQETTTTQARYVLPFACLIKNLSVNPTVNSGTNPITVTIMQNAGASALTVTIPASSTAVQTDAAHSVLYTPGSTIDLQTNWTATAGSFQMSATVEVDVLS